MMLFLISVAVALFAIFPLTDTDIWWHLACAREWVTTWTPVREPVINVHEYFQQVVLSIYQIGGASALVIFKALLWGLVFLLFLWPVRHELFWRKSSIRFFILLVIALLLFVFRFQFEMRPVVFSLLFLGVYWNVLPPFFARKWNARKTLLWAVFLLVVQWFWCKCQGLFILGPLFALVTCAIAFAISFCKGKMHGGFCCPKNRCAAETAFAVLLFLMPFLHREGLNLFLYPFGLLDRLLGMSPSATVFAKEIAENRSPLSLVLSGENLLQSLISVGFCVMVLVMLAKAAVKFRDNLKNGQVGEMTRAAWLVLMAVLALIAERNLVLFLPVALCVAEDGLGRLEKQKTAGLSLNSRSAIFSHALWGMSFFGISLVLGFWCKSLLAYDSAIAFQRVPVHAAEWMRMHPHEGKLFNDDRAGGYLAFVNPSDSVFIDGRFILKTSAFFERYLRYAHEPELFLHDADSLNVDRAIFPLRYYARWNSVLERLSRSPDWRLVYCDDFFAVMNRTAKMKSDAE